MAITYGASPGTIVTTAAVNETLGDQSQQTGSNTIVLSDDFVTLSNGNHGADTYPTRLCLIREGAADEEEIYIVSETAGTVNTMILTLAGDWTDVPASGDTVHISYNAKDADTLGGVSYSTRSGIYSANNILTIGNATDFAYFALVNGDIWECDDSRSATDPFLIVENNGRLNSGYLLNGIPVQGGVINILNNAAGEDNVYFKAGSIVRLYDTPISNPIADTKIYCDSSDTSDVLLQGSKIVKAAYELELFDAAFIDCKIQGTSNANDYVRVDVGFSVDGLVVINTAGFNTASADTTTEAITLRSVTWIGNIDYITLNSNKTWNVIDPTWGVTTYTDFTWDTSTLNYVYDQRSIQVTVQTAAGTALQNAMAIMYEGTTLDDLVVEAATDVSGQVDETFNYKLHSTNSSTTTYGTHAFRVDKWDYYPFIATQTSTEARTGVIVVAPDLAISQHTQATALTDGSGITWNEDTNPSVTIDYTAGSGTLLVGMIITGASSTKYGTVTKIVDGDSTAGTVHLKLCSATSVFTGGESISRTGGTAGTWSATYTAATEQKFSVWIDGNNKSMQVTHDYLAALSSETTLSASGELLHEWGKDSQARALYSGASGFYTERSGTEGIFITNFGAGTIQYFTDDAGVTWSPPVSLTLTMTVKDEGGSAVVTAFAYIDDDDSAPYLMNTTTNGSGIATTSYTGSPISDTRWRIRKYGYRPFTQLVDISTSDIDLPVTLIADPQQT